jgi:hypothetical protein
MIFLATLAACLVSRITYTAWVSILGARLFQTEVNGAITKATQTGFQDLDISVNIMTNYVKRPPLWPSGHSSWLRIQRFRVQFPALQDFLRSSGSGTGSAQPREDN